MRLRMVVGFMFCGVHVLLVNKQKPKWQKGLWNGVGGKVEDGETPVFAMPREFLEETGIKTTQDYWTHFGTEAGPGYELACYKAEVVTPTGVSGVWLPPTPGANDVGEELRWITVHTLHGYPKLGNLNWLIPLAKDWRKPYVAAQIHMHDDIKERASW